MTPQMRNILTVVVAVALAFGGGAAWQYTQAREARQAQDGIRRELALVQQERAMEGLERSVALATVAAQFGDFERARQLASDFFDRLQRQIENAPGSARSGLDAILAGRDGTITVLSRAQPEAGLEIATVLVALQRALGREPTISVPEPPVRER